MSDVSGELVYRRGKEVGKAVYQNRALSKDGISERLFAFLFSGLVYPQIWEDPDVDMEAMQLRAGHRVGKLFGVDPAGIMKARNIGEQRRFFNEELAPVFDKKLLRWAMSRKASLFGLGIPPAQYDSLITSGDGSMASVLKARLEKLACDFPLKNNYFAWQAFARRYPEPGEAALPAYLEQGNYKTIRANIDRVAIHHANLIKFLAGKDADSVDRFVLLDAQDWMTDDLLNDLWTELTRTASIGARVIFRTAGRAAPLESALSPALLEPWRAETELAASLFRRDRSAIYGGFHIYSRV